MGECRQNVPPPPTPTPPAPSPYSTSPHSSSSLSLSPKPPPYRPNVWPHGVYGRLSVYEATCFCWLKTKCLFSMSSTTAVRNYFPSDAVVNFRQGDVSFLYPAGDEYSPLPASVGLPWPPPSDTLPARAVVSCFRPTVSCWSTLCLVSIQDPCLYCIPLETYLSDIDTGIDMTLSYEHPFPNCMVFLVVIVESEFIEVLVPRPCVARTGIGG